MEPETDDIFAFNKAEHRASAKPRLLTIEPGWFLFVDGSGHPSGPEFASSLEALYACAYALRFRFKERGNVYSVGKLEALWHLALGYFDFATAPHDAWNWTLALRTPGFVGENDLEEVKPGLLEKGKPAAVRQVGLMAMEEGQCAQILHVGPYDQEGPTLKILNKFIEDKELTVVGRHHEIYLSDPRRTAPEKLKTILRLPVI